MMEKSREIQFIPEAHTKEHSLEMQIPFLQVALKSFKLVPIVMEPDWTWESCQSLARPLPKPCRERTCCSLPARICRTFTPMRRQWSWTGS